MSQLYASSEPDLSSAIMEASSALTAIALAMLPNVTAPAILFMASPQQYQVRATATTFSRDYGGNARTRAVTYLYRPRRGKKVPATQSFIEGSGVAERSSFSWICG